MTAALGGPAAGEIPALARHNPQAIDEIMQCVEDGTYCAVLGPRLSGKTVLLRFVERTLAESLGRTCVYLDLYEVRASTLQGFFAELMAQTAQRLKDLTGQSLPPLEGGMASSAVFRGFLADALMTLQRDLVLIIEHLEAVPADLVQALLTSLRAAFMDQQTLDYRVMVVVSGALSLATLTVGESSPFRGIARRVFVGDLSKRDSEALIDELLGAEGVSVTRRAQRRLVQATSGDAYLIRQLCQRTAEVARATESRRLRAGNVKEVTRQFLTEEVYGYAPLQEAVRLIEEDPDLLQGILLLLAHGTVPKAELPLPLSPDLDPLYLTGVVEQVGAGGYRLQNRIYRRFLERHFQPARVGHLLSMTGRWDSAIDYLEAGISEGDQGARSDLLTATINSMYASEDVAQAAHFLIRGLSAGFGVCEARVWYAPPQEARLRQVGHMGPKADAAQWSRPEMPATADRLEARAYRQGRALRGREGERHVWRAIPLQMPGRRPLGVVTVCDDLATARFAQQRERDLQLQGYLNQAARALQVVSTRRRELTLAGRMQASLLPAAPPEVAGWQLAASLQPALETAGDFFDFIPLPGGRLGLVIADVADKGMGAALYMALARTLIRTYAGDYPDRPDLALEAANGRILADTGADLFVTVFYGILETGSGLLTYCNAGHHPPYLLPPPAPANAPLPTGSPELPAVEPLPGRSMAIGVLEDAGWHSQSVHIPPGAGLLLYTDGVADAQNRVSGRFGTEGLLAFAQSHLDHPAQAMHDALLARLQQYRGEEPQFDDITLMVVRRMGG
jgi:ABC-type cobalamin/Fe3+-siderophores transport system ATPase subunit